MFQNNILSILITFFCGLSLFAQDLKGDLQLISEKMKTASSVFLEVDINVFDQKGGRLRFSTDAIVAKQGEYYKNILGNNAFILTPDFEVKVDHEEEAILIYDRKKRGKPKKEKNEVNSSFDIESIKKYLELGSETEVHHSLVSDDSGIKHYRVSGIEGITHIDVKLDMNKLSLLSVSYESVGNSQSNIFTEVSYKKFIYDLDLTESFSLEEYFTVNNDLYSLSESLKGYQLYTEL